MDLTKKQISALARHESEGNPKALGDHGRAFGLYQMHNDFRSDWYDIEDALQLAGLDKSALIQFADCFYERFNDEWAGVDPDGLNIPPESLELLMLCYNQGSLGAAHWLVGAPGRTPAEHPYVKKYIEILASIVGPDTH